MKFSSYLWRLLALVWPHQLFCSTRGGSQLYLCPKTYFQSSPPPPQPLHSQLLPPRLEGCPDRLHHRGWSRDSSDRLIFLLSQRLEFCYGEVRAEVSILSSLLHRAGLGCEQRTGPPKAGPDTSCSARVELDPVAGGVRSSETWGFGLCGLWSWTWTFWKGRRLDPKLYP